LGRTHVCPPQPWREIDAHDSRGYIIAQKCVSRVTIGEEPRNTLTH